ncbi:hypothetical protein [Streptosporangium sp. NPDC002524]|uniref:hypothetical protein n=1 Tax=Streptosporangium sp. NPDC002524 TaxID=3154537 RepID=UPI003332491C
MTPEPPEFDVVENPDGALGARREDSSANAPADVTASTFRDLELGGLAARVAWTLRPGGETG